MVYRSIIYFLFYSNVGYSLPSRQSLISTGEFGGRACDPWGSVAISRRLSSFCKRQSRSLVKAGDCSDGMMDQWFAHPTQQKKHKREERSKAWYFFDVWVSLLAIGLFWWSRHSTWSSKQNHSHWDSWEGYAKYHKKEIDNKLDWNVVNLNQGEYWHTGC